MKSKVLSRGLLYRFLAVSALLHVAVAMTLWVCPLCKPPQVLPKRRVLVSLRPIPVSPAPAAPAPQPKVQELPPPKAVQPPPPPKPVVATPKPRPKPAPVPPKPQPTPVPKPVVVAPPPPTVQPVEQTVKTEPTVPMSSVAPVPLPSPSVTTPVQSGPVTPEHRWQDDYGLAVRKLIEQHKRYPLMARRAGMEGVVEIDFVIARDGKLLSGVVRKSSGYTVLDRAALRAVQDVEAFPPLPVQATDQEVNFKLPLAFRLDR